MVPGIGAMVPGIGAMVPGIGAKKAYNDVRYGSKKVSIRIKYGLDLQKFGQESSRRLKTALKYKKW